MVMVLMVMKTIMIMPEKRRSLLFYPTTFFVFKVINCIENIKQYVCESFLIQSMIPLKWTAIETLQDGTSNFKSDV